MAKTVALTGNHAIAQAMRQINPDVVAAYPITPQTQIVEEFSTFVAQGIVDTEFVNVESEHSAMSACIGAAASGARVMTTTSSQGLALMWEELYIAASLRLPIVMHDANRALSGPINIHCDHSDTMGARDSGWIQIFSEHAQEAYDNTVQAARIAEHADVRLPVMVNLDGFIISHAIDRLDLLDDDEVKAFVGPPGGIEATLLDVDAPITVGPFDGLYGFYEEHKYRQTVAMKAAKGVILEIASDFAELSGRGYGFFEPYKMDDAEVAIIVLGSTAGTVRASIDKARERGVKVGMIKLRVFRPFPAEELAAALAAVKAVAVMDRSDSFGAACGPVFLETRSALYGLAGGPVVANYVYGLGGRDVGFEDIERVINETVDRAKTGDQGALVTYLSLRE